VNTQLDGSDVGAGIRRVGSVRFQGATQVKVPLRAGRGGAGGLRAAVHPASRSRCTDGGGECSWCSRKGPDLSDDIGAQPNMRVKLPAPAFNSYGFRPTRRFASFCL